jgi:hypothetical protein
MTRSQTLMRNITLLLLCALRAAQLAAARWPRTLLTHPMAHARNSWS